MAKQTRRKTEKIATEITKEQFDQALAEYSANDIKLVQIRAELEEEVQAINEEFAPDIELLTSKQSLLFATMKAFVIEKRDELLPGKEKSFDNLFAKIGFRKDPPSIKTLSGVTLAVLVERLKKNNLTDYIRTVEEPNKELLLADRDKEIAAMFPELGIKVAQDEKFFVELKKSA